MRHGRGTPCINNKKALFKYPARAPATRPPAYCCRWSPLSASPESVLTGVLGDDVELEHAVHGGRGLDAQRERAAGRVQREGHVPHGLQRRVHPHAGVVDAVRYCRVLRVRCLVKELHYFWHHIQKRKICYLPDLTWEVQLQLFCYVQFSKVSKSIFSS